MGEFSRESVTRMRRFMQLALVAFLIAAMTGVLLRFGLFLGMPAWAQNFTAIRHAHSHLMYFGWATLALMALIWRLLPQWTHKPLPRVVYWQMSLTAVMAFLSFPAFWSNGYGLTQLGSAALPLGSMFAGLNGLMWIFFAIIYARVTASVVDRPLPIQLWDWAIVLLLLAFAGALGLTMLIVLGVENIFLQQAMLHLFLELFATGWFTMALLGLLWAWVGQHTLQRVWLPTQSLALCLGPTFLLGVTPGLVPTSLFWISAIANFGAALLLARHLYLLWQQRAHLPLFVRFGLLALAVHLLISVAILWPGLWQWSGGTQLRVFYLHNLLLGWVSSGLLGLVAALWLALPGGWAQWLRAAWWGGVACMLLALLGIGILPVWPLLSARLWLQLAAWSSIIIVGCVCGLTLRTLFGRTAPETSPAIQPETVSL